MLINSSLCLRCYAITSLLWKQFRERFSLHFKKWSGIEIPLYFLNFSQIYILWWSRFSIVFYIPIFTFHATVKILQFSLWFVNLLYVASCNLNDEFYRRLPFSRHSPAAGSGLVRSPLGEPSCKGEGVVIITRTEPVHTLAIINL